jgi:hypothetical protein
MSMEMGAPRLLNEKCSTCVFRPGNLMHLRPGRLTLMIRNALTGGGWITCHQTLSYGEHPDFGEAICRGFYDMHGDRSNLIRIMERLDGFTEVSPPVDQLDP